MKLYNFVDWKNRTIILEERKPYEPLFEKSLEDIRKDWNVIDAGAGIGFYTIPMAIKATKGRIFAFEPHPDTQKVLQQNIEMYNLKNITIVPKALSDKPEEKIEMWESDTFGGTSIHHKRKLTLRAKLGIYRRKLLGTYKKPKEKKFVGFVETDTIDNFVSKNLFKINLIKMDIQGMEYKALLKGGYNVLTVDKPLLLIEVHKRKHFKQEDFLNSLKNMGYSLTIERPPNETAILVKGVVVK